MNPQIDLNTLTVYHNLLELPFVSALNEMLARRGKDKTWSREYGSAYFALAQAGQDSPAAYLGQHLYYDESPFACAVAEGRETEILRHAAEHDLLLLETALNEAEYALRVEGVLPVWGGGELPTLEELMDSYRKNGCGQFARCKAFVWENGGLYPVERPDYVPEGEMLGYERQRNQLAANTRALLAGHRVNNVLLYGVSGTGKSATVKSLLGMEGMENLRIIELDKSDLPGIPQLVRMLGHQSQKFILFIDDLAFDKDDRSYSILKTILEGGVEPRPSNVAVYATSNRRHLVRETFSDRAGDEVDARETIQEKTSLSERFGLRILFHELSKPQFLQMIRDMAAQRGVEMPEEQLMALAVKWDIRNPNRTPRSAVQFIDSLPTL